MKDCQKKAHCPSLLSALVPLDEIKLPLVCSAENSWYCNETVSSG